MPKKPVKKLRFVKLSEKAKEPSRGSKAAAGWDLFATSMEYQDGKIIYGTGLAIEIPDGYYGKIVPRSSVYKTGLILCNSSGVIDSDYRGEIKAMFYCHLAAEKAYTSGDRVCQLIIQRYQDVKFEEVSELSETERGEAGFGSTGD